MKIITSCAHLPSVTPDSIMDFFRPSHDGKMFLVIELCSSCFKRVASPQIQSVQFIDPLEVLKDARK